MPIPKKIHYCWFGPNPLPLLAQKCIASWKRLLPDYELCFWNENNFDLDVCRYVRQAYNSNKFAFVWDYVRIFTMYHFGGISMDTDVEVLRGLDKFLLHRGFSGFETKDIVPTGIMGFEEGHPYLKEILDHYENTSFVDNSGKLILTPNTVLISRLAPAWGFVGGKDRHIVLGADFHIYPERFFCPKNDRTKIVRDPDAHTIHYFAGSWLPRRSRIFRKVMSVPIGFCKFLGIYGTVGKFYRKYILKSE